MNTLASIFSRAGHKALIAYVAVGYPSIKDTLEVVPMLASGGCDAIELGIPFSDPMADGVTIQKASFGALANGVTPQICLEVAQQLQQKVDVPLLFMTYLNPVYRYGYAEFCAESAASGVKGLIIPDLPPEEGLSLEEAARKQGLDLVYLLAPMSTAERVGLVAKRATGFIYLVSVSGVTGARESLPDNLKDFVARVRSVTQKPLCVGFGISTPEQAGEVARIADGVIIGSRVIQLMEINDGFASLKDFVKEARKAVDESIK